MKIISPKIHGLIDYLVVLFLLGSPQMFGFTGLLANFTYILGAIHLILTLITNFEAGLFKLVPLPLHGLIELIVGVLLIGVAYTLFADNAAGKVFYTGFGMAVILVWFLTDYKSAKKL